MNTELFSYTPEQREAAETIARIMTARGIPLTTDEAQVMANLAQYVQPTIDEHAKVLGTKATRVLAGQSATAEACLATIAQHVVKQHTLAYDDVNLRGLSTMQTVIAVVAALTRDKPFKHATGG